MKHRNASKEKGSAYEREISKRLSQWWCDTDTALFRNAGSGNRKVVGAYAGDIAPASDLARPWPLCVEVKCAQRWSVEGFLQGNTGEASLLAHMLQCLSDSQLGCNKIPLLICKKTRQQPLCFLHPYGFSLDATTKPFLARLKWIAPVPVLLRKRYPWEGPIDFFVLGLEAFLVSFSHRDFLSVVEMARGTGKSDK